MCCRDVTFELNGTQRTVKVSDKAAAVTNKSANLKADPSVPGSVGCPMPGVIIGMRVKVGDPVSAGDPLVVISAMKMETTVTSPVSGIVKAIHCKEGSQLAVGDLVVEIQA